MDNHSDDNTDEVVNEFRNPRIRLIKIHNHGVIAASRNLGMRESSGEWVTFLDSDDCWYPQRLETIMAAIEADPTSDVFSNDELMIDQRTGMQRVLRYGPYEDEFYRVLLVDGNRLSPSATTIRRTFLEKHGLGFGESQTYVTVEDYDLWLNLARAGAHFKFIRDVLGEYVIHGANSSADLDRHWHNYEELVHDHVFNIQQFHPSPNRLWKHVYTRLQLRKARNLAAIGRHGDAVKSVSLTFMRDPAGAISFTYSRLKRWSEKCY